MSRADVSPLLTDLYQLTMIQGYLEHGMTAPASFEFFARRLPQNRGFLLACGLEQALQYLEQLSFSDDEIAWLESTGRFSTALLDWLAQLRFDGDVDAMPEGTACFPDEPMLRVTASLPLAQLVETRLINILHFQTLIASKAARIRLAAPEKQLVDFGLRRAHGAEAGLMAARAAWIAGFDASSNVLAGMRLGMPVAGTMAHSWVLAHDSEHEAFLHFAHSHPETTVLLIDTRDTERGAEHAARAAAELAREGIHVRGVRLDSGDLAGHARKVRRILDRAGLREVTIFASGNLDECQIHELEQAGAPIDGYGVGTRLTTSADAPYLDCACKLQEYAGIPRRKTSEGKATWPGRKQVWRKRTGGRIVFDTLGLMDEACEGEPLLKPVMRQGRRTGPSEALDAIRTRAAGELASLPPECRALEHPVPPPVRISPALQQLARTTDARIDATPE